LKLQQRIDFRGVAGRDREARPGLIDRVDDFKSGGLGDGRTRAEAGAEGGGVAVVGIADRIVEPVGGQQGGAAIVAAVVDGGGVAQSTVRIHRDDGTGEGIVRAEGKGDRIGRILPGHRIGIGHIERTHARPGIAYEYHMGSAPVLGKMKTEFRF